MKNKISFTDKLIYDKDTKKCISIRDGYQEYLGSELGKEPANKIFTVYRSPQTIKDASSRLEGIPLTIGHIPLDDKPLAPSGSIKSSLIVNIIDEATVTTLAIENELIVNDVLDNIEHKEFSLGYFADIIPHNGDFDFEQVDIIPHHLALVKRGRCGSICSFSDELNQNKENTMKNKLFFDEDGQLNMQQIVEAVAALPEVIKSVPLDKLQEIMPAVNELVSAANAAGVEVETEANPEAEPEMEAEEMEDMEAEEEEKTPVTDSAEFKDALAKGISEAVTRHGEVIEKAKLFVDEDYSFTGKKTCTIMRDALATQHGKQEFGDEELSVAFKMLKKTADYTNFTDSKTGSLADLKDKEL